MSQESKTKTWTHGILIVVCILAPSAVAVDSASTRAQTSESALEEFVPTEKVPIDSSLSFPVDI